MKLVPTILLLISVTVSLILSQSEQSSKTCRCLRPTSPPSILQLWRVSHTMVLLGPCSFYMGSNSSVAIRGDGEEPVRQMSTGTSFWMDITEVTKVEFARFVQNTNYRTTAEEFGTSFVFSPKNLTGSLRIHPQDYAGWWIERKSVTWKSDLNPSTIHHPVTHVSWTDALAFCTWRLATLPSEIEWEFACRGGLENCLFPWGNKLRPNGEHMANIWQGRFPVWNSVEDGFEETAPVGSFPPNGYGLYDFAGNVWEWVYDAWSPVRSDVRLQKGGSFMCHRMHCYRYRCGARTKGSADSTSSNLGFRCVEQAN